MSIYDLTQRANAVLKKYEKYDMVVETKTKTDDPFMEEYYEVEAEVEKLMDAAADIMMESNRAVIAAKHAEIRRAKNILATEALESLQKKVKKGKGVTKEKKEERLNLIKEITDKIYSIPDGMSSAPNRRPMRYGVKNGMGSKANPVLLNAENGANGIKDNPLYHQHTEATQAFEKEVQLAFKKQDEALDRIERGVGTLGEIARAMNEEMDRQNPIIDDIEHQMDKVTSQLKSNNAKLKGLVHRMRSARNFCVDVILICILLAIGSYLYTTFARR